MIDIRIDTEVRPNGSVGKSLYSVVVDGELFCTTEDDNEGFRLMVAVEKQQLAKETRK